MTEVALTRETIAARWETDKPFDRVVADLQEQSAANSFRVLAVHDVRATLAEKGFQRDPLTIIEICNAGFAHQALQKDIDVALFMPCRFVVYTDSGKTHVSLSRPSMIAGMLPGSGLEDLAGEVEQTLRKVAEASL